jgi:pilus assembly protein Flp/PilA
MSDLLRQFAKDESGATAIEYALIAAIVGIGIIVALTQLGVGLNDIYTKVGSKLTGFVVP